MTTKNVFILRVEKYNETERDLVVNECYQSRTNAIKAMSDYFEVEKKKWIEGASWRTEEDFKSMSSYSSTEAKISYISYGWGSDTITICFTITRLKVKDFKNN